MLKRVVALLVLSLLANVAPAGETKRIKILFLGDKGHHRPQERYRQILPVLAKRGIDLAYVDNAAALNADTLAKYDGLLVYANLEKISPAQEAALLDYVAQGKGFIPLHCASYCFLNSPKYIDLVGAQFKKHGTGVFRTKVAQPDHPVMKGFQAFESWDETYVHAKHNEKDRVVLEFREEAGAKEPWTWIRTHGKGRVFYTAWGHDERTWGNDGFQDLLERGIRWSVGAELAVVQSFNDRPVMTAKQKDVKPFEYKEAKLPFYPPPAKSGLNAKAISQMQLPLDAAESMKHFVHPAQFEVKRFAADPKIKRPICMNWDERGRLWIAESVDYPNEIKPAGQGRDRIVICEDTDGDGEADKFTVFADKLSIPTTFAFWNGGVIVHQAPHTLFLKDTDGDDVADVRTTLFSGWNPGDTHAGPSNLQWGLDNWLYGVVGYSGFEGRIGTERQSFRTGFYRFRPDSLQFEFLRNTSNNTWGIGFNEEGSLFGSTANGNPSVYLPIPNRYYEQVRGWSSRVLGAIAASNKFDPVTDKVRQVDYHGGFTAAAGHSLYTARTYPKDYWNRVAFVAEPTGHLLATFTIKANGADFASRNAYNLLASDDEWSSPIMAEVGPDGCVWVIDWYNYIVQHNPTPPGFKNGKGNAYETDLRDKTHGRVYRLVPKGTKLPTAITLKDASPEKLVETLKNDNLFWRKHAQRLLVERGKRDVVPALVKLANDPSMDEIGLNVGAIHALWTLQGIGAVKDGDAEALKAVDNALSHKSAGVRRNAIQVAPRQSTTVKAILDRKLLDDADAQVRLSALLALAEMPTNRDAARALAAVLQKGDILSDRWLSEALTAAAAKHDHFFLEAVASEHPVKETKGLEIVRIVAEHYARGASDKAGALVKRLDKASLPIAEIILVGLQKGWPKGKRPEAVEGLDDAMTKLLVKLPTTSKGALIRIALEWKVQGFEQQVATITAALDKTLADEKAPEKSRLEAARQLVDLNPSDDKIVEKLFDLATPRSSPTLVSGLLDALAASTSPKLAPTLIERLATFGPQAKQQALRVLLARPESTKRFLDGVEKGELAFNDLVLDQKQALAAHPDKQIAARARKLLEKGGSLPSADRQKVLDELLPVMKRTGDATVGKAVFKKHCAICHTHSGEGVKIGPDLSGVAVHTKEHLLIDIIDPSRSVEGNYRLYVVSTTEGKVLSGLLASETKTTVELYDTQGKKLVLQRDQIDQLTASTKSMMPEGFEKSLKQEELVDLLEFLTTRGKFVPLALDKVASVVSTQGMFFSKESTIERMILKDWSPKQVKGVPFQLVDPQGDKQPNMVMLYGPNGTIAPTMPKSVKLTCNMPARAVHLLSGVSGWGHVPGAKEGGVAMIVRLHYADGQTEDHPLLDGVHFADYIRKVDVPKSEYAFPMRGQQMRYLSVTPMRSEPLAAIELVKGSHPSAPLVLAVTVETK